ncbi:MAG: NTP transferase domain-containing protein [Myxococcales bacterium]|nr:NTP transferase domain-containing protein [Myxococcales bacterium]
MTQPRTAVLLAGGLGSRLAPFTAVIPKPLVPIGERESIAEVVLQQLAHHGFERAIISIGYLGHLIKAVIGDGSRYGLQVEYVTEDSPLGTVGPLRLVADRLPETFLLLNGDVLTDLDFSGLLAQHTASDKTLTVATYPRQVKIDLGVLDTDDSGSVTGFREKPTYDFYVSMGVYAMHRRVLACVPEGQPFGFDNLMHHLLESGDAIGTFDWGKGRWLDIGRHDDFALAQTSFAKDRAIYLPWESDS